jgi:hypothetical protein
MIWIIAFNAGMFLLGAVVATGLVSAARLEAMLFWLHGIVGITSPPPEKARVFALVWIALTLVMVDGLLSLLVFLTRSLM